jgi:hypothetical protein
MLQLHIDINYSFVLLLRKSAKNGVKMTKNPSESFERACRDYQVQQQYKGLRDGSLVMIEGTDTIVTRDEFRELVTDLSDQGFRLVSSPAIRNATALYLDDKRLVFVASVEEEAPSNQHQVMAGPQEPTI